MTEKRIEYDDNAYNIIAVTNELLEEQKINLEFVFDQKEHDGYDLLSLREKS